MPANCSGPASRGNHRARQDTRHWLRTRASEALVDPNRSILADTVGEHVLAYMPSALALATYLETQLCGFDRAALRSRLSRHARLSRVITV